LAIGRPLSGVTFEQDAVGMANLFKQCRGLVGLALAAQNRALLVILVIYWTMGPPTTALWEGIRPEVVAFARDGAYALFSWLRRKWAAQPTRSITLSEKKKSRTWTAAQKLEIVLAGLRGEVSIAELCREHQISENLYYTWRNELLEGSAERLSGKEDRTELLELRKLVRDLERTLGRKT
jgi:transposase-like protein